MPSTQSMLFADYTAVLHRLFFALQPSHDEATRINTAVSGWSENYPGSRWVKSSRYHVTLHFLGESDGRRGDQIVLAQQAVQGLQSPSFKLSLDQWMTLGNPAHPALVLASSTVPEGLRLLRQRLQARLLRAGFRLAQHKAQAFVPHLTVAYTQPQPLLTTITPQLVQVDEIALLLSVQGQSEHELLGRWPLLSSVADNADPTEDSHF